ncbi:MAG TPA: YceI family protein [Pedobacter sp.]|nr:YceI family protein [Pedobacter sp.]
MKLKITSLALILIVAVSSAFAPAFKATSYKVDPTKSSLTWVGKKLTGSHNGTIALQSGDLLFNGKKLAGGNFAISMATIKDADGSDKLEGHLKADDFFGVDKFATSNFAIKKVTGSGSTVNVTGDLTIKGITNSITFPAAVVWNADGSVTATASKIVVDRTKYGIKFRSKGVFPDVGDKMIYDDFELAIKLVATK